MGYWLVMQAGDGRERLFAISKPCMVIGSETNCDVRVPVPTGSNKHCQITFDGQSLKLTDLRSEGGTFHNGNKVDETHLVHEDKLMIGPVLFVIRSVQDDVASGDQAGEIIIERIADVLPPDGQIQAGPAANV